MKNTAIAVTAAIMGLSASASTEAGVVLGSLELTDQGGIGLVFDSYTVSFGMIKDFNPLPENQILFADNVLINDAAVGTTWVSDPATTALITAQWGDGDMFDGIGVGVEHTLPNGDVFGYFVGVLEFDFPTHGLDLSLLASQTNEIHVTLLSFSTVSPGDDPNGDGIWTNYSATFLFEFVGVPAPGAFALLLIGAVPSRRRRC